MVISALRNPRITLMAWTCSKCTFINPPTQKSTCQICLSSFSSLSSSPSSSSSATPKWSCKACTFLNPFRNTNCEICGTRASAMSVSALEDDELDSSVGSVFFPLKACKRKNPESPIEIAEDCVEASSFPGVKSSNKAVTSSGPLLFFYMVPVFVLRLVAYGDESVSKADSRTLKVLSYNVWFREDLEMPKRMKALGELIQLHSPDVICFQEVTSNIYKIFQESSWWKVYHCSVSESAAFTRPYFCMQASKLPVKSYSCKPFRNSIMGRELCTAEVEVQPNIPLVIATTHLESPCPAPPTWDQMFSKERVDQAKEALDFLKKNNPNMIFGGDMNWDDKLDGQFPVPEGWEDAWVALRPEENGWTYDTKSNAMLSGNWPLQKRLDRFVCNLRDFKISGIEMIGLEAIPGLSYCKEKKVKREVRKLVLPVLPSDHYGLLLTISLK